jgi:hypothetical protein
MSYHPPTPNRKHSRHLSALVVPRKQKEAKALPRRGERFSLSLGERAGVRAGFLLVHSHFRFIVRCSSPHLFTCTETVIKLYCYA